MSCSEEMYGYYCARIILVMKGFGIYKQTTRTLYGCGMSMQVCVPNLILR